MPLMTTLWNGGSSLLVGSGGGCSSGGSSCTGSRLESSLRTGYCLVQVIVAGGIVIVVVIFPARIRWCIHHCSSTSSGDNACCYFDSSCPNSCSLVGANRGNVFGRFYSHRYFRSCEKIFSKEKQCV